MVGLVGFIAFSVYGFDKLYYRKHIQYNNQSLKSKPPFSLHMIGVKPDLRGSDGLSERPGEVIQLCQFGIG
jgi:hypothetical protein